MTENIQIALTRKEEDIVGEKSLDEITIKECNEPLVKIIDYVPSAIIRMRKERKRFPEETLYARKTVAEQLAKIAEDVFPLKLVIYDAFRPIEIQEEWYNKTYKRIKEKNQSWTAEELRAETFKFIFPPSWDLQTPPAHSTGGAIDLNLANENGIEFEMGSAYGNFDSPYICTNAKGIAKKQKENRILLVTTMCKQDFVNYPGEWWHFSVGDREWIVYSGLKDQSARYGRANDPCKGK